MAAAPLRVRAIRDVRVPAALTLYYRALYGLEVSLDDGEIYDGR